MEFRKRLVATYARFFRFNATAISSLVTYPLSDLLATRACSSTRGFHAEGFGRRTHKDQANFLCDLAHVDERSRGRTRRSCRFARSASRRGRLRAAEHPPPLTHLVRCYSRIGMHFRIVVLI